MKKTLSFQPINPNKSELWETLELWGVVEADTTLIGYNRSHTIRNYF